MIIIIIMNCHGTLDGEVWICKPNAANQVTIVTSINAKNV